MGKRKRGQQYYYRWYEHYRRQLYELALTVFKWENLPPTVSERWIEKNLIDNGNALFCDHPEIGYTVLQTAVGGNLDETMSPTQFTPVAPNLMNIKQFDITNSVPIYNNYLRTPNVVDIEMFAQDLAESKATKHVNIQAQKTPRVYVTTDRQKLSAITAVAQMDTFEPSIFVDKGLDLDRFKVIETPTPFIADKLELDRKATFNEAMTFLGINNANQDKKERLVESEVSANDSQVITSMLSMLKSRLEACDKINKMFGLNIDVTPREKSYDLEMLKKQALAEIALDNKNKEGDNGLQNNSTTKTD